MEALKLNFEQVKNALWRSKLGRFISILRGKIEQGKVPMDPLAQHEYEARGRGEPAHFDRVQELRKQERQAHHDRWV